MAAAKASTKTAATKSKAAAKPAAKSAKPASKGAAKAPSAHPSWKDMIKVSHCIVYV